MLNLAAKPHVNLHSVRRVAIILWIGTFLVLGANLILYWNYFASQGSNAVALREAAIELDREAAAIEEILARLSDTDIEFQIRLSEALNQRIAQRVFSWSSLFDRLAEVLPTGVSINRLSPRVSVLKKPLGIDPKIKIGATIVDLGISGSARNDPALLELVDRLFEHPNFTRPNLSSEVRRGGRELSFSLTVTFLPEPWQALDRDSSNDVAVAEFSGEHLVSANHERYGQRVGNQG